MRAEVEGVGESSTGTGDGAGRASEAGAVDGVELASVEGEVVVASGAGVVAGVAVEGDAEKSVEPRRCAA